MHAFHSHKEDVVLLPVLSVKPACHIFFHINPRSSPGPQLPPHSKTLIRHGGQVGVSMKENTKGRSQTTPHHLCTLAHSAIHKMAIKFQLHIRNDSSKCPRLGEQPMRNSQSQFPSLLPGLRDHFRRIHRGHYLRKMEAR